MPLTLNTPQSISAQLSSVKITSFAIDLDRAEMYVSYNEISEASTVVSQKIITISGVDFTTAIVDANTAAGADVYTAIKASLYAQIQQQTGVSGVIA